MGTIIHDAVLVTAIIDDRMPDLDAFRATLSEDWRRLVIGPVQSITNGYAFAAFLPDGSKEGWASSDEGDGYRDRFAALFHDDYFDVVRVRYGGDISDEPTVLQVYQSDED